MAEWTVTLRDVPDPDLTYTVKPESLSGEMNLGVIGPHTLSFEIAKANPVVAHNFIGPRRSDFELRRDGDLIFGGICSLLGGTDASDEFFKFAGTDWLGYLQGRQWPYDTAVFPDPNLNNVRYPDGFYYQQSPLQGGPKEVGAIVADWLTMILTLKQDSADPFGNTPATSFCLDFTVDCDDTGIEIYKTVAPQDGVSSFYELIRDLAVADKADGGFDFGMEGGFDEVVFRLYAPEYGDKDSPIYTVTVAESIESGFTNTGPTATHVLGTAGSERAVNRHFPDSSEFFRRWDQRTDFGSIDDITSLASLTGQALAFGANPVHEIPVKVKPEAIPDFWTVTRPGAYIWLTQEHEFHMVDSQQKIVSIPFTVDNEGNEEVELGLNQWYDVSGASGLVEW